MKNPYVVTLTHDRPRLWLHADGSLSAHSRQEDPRDVAGIVATCHAETTRKLDDPADALALDAAALTAAILNAFGPDLTDLDDNADIGAWIIGELNNNQADA